MPNEVGLAAPPPEVTRAGSGLGCMFCGAYDREVAVARISMVSQPFPASICKRCAEIVSTGLRVILDEDAAAESAGPEAGWIEDGVAALEAADETDGRKRTR